MRAGLLGVAIAWRLANFKGKAVKSRQMPEVPQTGIDELDARADWSGYVVLGGVFFLLALFGVELSNS